jgi:hypothetical protein
VTGNRPYGRYVRDKAVTDETLEERAIDVRLAIALDNEALSWTMSTVITIARYCTRGGNPGAQGVTTGCNASQRDYVINSPADFVSN